MSEIYEPGKTWTFNDHTEAQDHGEFLASWGYGVYIRGNKVWITSGFATR